MFFKPFRCPGKRDTLTAEIGGLMCVCGIERPCMGKCACGCSHDAGDLIAWNLGYERGRAEAAEDISRMRDVDEVCMEEIEKDPQLDESYILIRRTDAEEVARGSGKHTWRT